MELTGTKMLAAIVAGLVSAQVQINKHMIMGLERNINRSLKGIIEVCQTKVMT